jgi:Mrp family chromosome partitioning ATPase
VQALVDEFTAELGAVFKDRARASVSANRAALDAAANAVANAQNANDLTLAQQQQAAALDRYNQSQLSSSGAVDPTAFHVVDPPKVPTAPASRKKALIMSGAGGLLGGGVITILALVLVMAQDRSVREEKDVESTLDLEVVGTVPQFDKSVVSSGGRRRQHEPHEWFWTPPGLIECCTVALRHLEQEEPTRAQLPRVGLRVTLPAAGRGQGPSASRNIGVTSCLRGEGRTTIAMGMAAAAHQAYGRRAILIELDFDAPSLARRLRIDSGPGVAEILRDGASIEECLHTPEDGSAGVLLAGNVDGDSARLLSSLRSSDLVRNLADLCDVVIADLPPLSPIGQASSLAPLFPTVVMVVRSGAAPVNQIRRAVDDLHKSPPVVLNGVASSIPRPLRSLLAG